MSQGNNPLKQIKKRMNMIINKHYYIDITKTEPMLGMSQTWKIHLES